MCRQSGPSGVLLPPTAKINSRFWEGQQDTTSGGRRCVRFAYTGLGFVFVLINSWLPPPEQTATDSSSNSSQKREQPTRTISSPTSCEHRRIYTLGHLHDPYPTDHYHLEQVGSSLVPLRAWGGRFLILEQPPPPSTWPDAQAQASSVPHMGGDDSSSLLRFLCARPLAKPSMSASR